ncbi:YNFM family putative membrane transporter [Azospirillum fermentarium]|uniref:MFS transporter n=1 Tax=Azospirillum fermentarium TaxID=1233114 RepID=UPI0022267119|nr:MFS transporter [Azospirillum fermentarium]MCW2246291.1 YNFM family putative membrane transporter [Azospirillum fermentarium]
MQPTAVPDTGHFRSGTPEYRRASLALFVGGFSTFALLYCVQPLMPQFAADYGQSPASASLALSVSTLMVALFLIPAGSASEAWGRKGLMVAALVASGLLTVAAALAPGFQALLACRLLLGIALSGLPAVAMTYLAEEMHPACQGRAMGLYIAGNALGGMAGRLVAGLVSEWVSWRLAVGGIGVLGVLAGLTFWRILPPSAHFTPNPLPPRQLMAALGEHLGDRGMRGLFLLGLLLLGCFVSLFNFIGFRLAEAPFNLSHSALAALFTIYVIGSFSSAGYGRLADRLGRGRVLWSAIALMLLGVGLTLGSSLWVVMAGITLTTIGFFGAHTVASSWVGRRAGRGKAHASSLYLFFYYLGSAVIGSGAGLFWSGEGWTGVAAVLLTLLTLALGVALALRHLAPIATKTA